MTVTILKTVLYIFYKFIKDIYDNRSVAVKVILLIIGFSLLLVISTLLFFPLTIVIIGLLAWLALKQVKKYNVIKKGVARIKDGDINHHISLDGNGEFKKLATDINSIVDGLNKAVENELKSERLKAELITNVSHDIRTPLTSIITYVDLLKKEEDLKRKKEYIEITENKSHRLKNLTDDLFEASKASSGNIPVNYEKIDIVSLITQGLGELNDEIEESKLEFKIN